MNSPKYTPEVSQERIDELRNRIFRHILQQTTQTSSKGLALPLLDISKMEQEILIDMFRQESVPRSSANRVINVKYKSTGILLTPMAGTGAQVGNLADEELFYFHTNNLKKYLNFHKESSQRMKWPNQGKKQVTSLESTTESS